MWRRDLEAVCYLLATSWARSSALKVLPNLAQVETNSGPASSTRFHVQLGDIGC
jgi:hypothetical protein